MAMECSGLEILVIAHFLIIFQFECGSECGGRTNKFASWGNGGNNMLYNLYTNYLGILRFNYRVQEGQVGKYQSKRYKKLIFYLKY